MAKSRRYRDRDTIARCEPPSMLYDMIRNPCALSKPAGHVIFLNENKSFRTASDNKLYERLQKTATPLLRHLLFPIAFVVKCLCLAGMIPLYYCLYIVPMWMHVHIIQPVGTFLKLYLSKIFGWLIKIYQKIVHPPIKSILEAVKKLGKIGLRMIGLGVGYATALLMISIKLMGSLLRRDKEMVKKKFFSLNP